MSALGRFDPDLQMFVEEARGIDLAHLAFLRWLAEHERLEHGVVSAPTGEYATMVRQLSEVAICA